MNLVTGRTFDNEYYVVACAGALGIDGDMSPRSGDRRRSIGVSASILHRDRPHGNVPRSSTEAAASFR